MKRTAALIASTALLVPTAVLVSPADAVSDATTADRIKNCSKARHGVTVRIKLRDNGQFTRVRISHPRAKGHFYAPKVVRVAGFKWWAGAVSPPDADGRQIGGPAVGEGVTSMPPSFRIGSAAGGASAGVNATFKLRNGKAIRVGCALR